LTEQQLEWEKEVKVKIFDWAFFGLCGTDEFEKKCPKCSQIHFWQNFWKMCTVLKSDPKLGLLLLFSNKLLKLNYVPSSRRKFAESGHPGVGCGTREEVALSQLEPIVTSRVTPPAL
jgi:hypothetical protein